MFEARIYLFWSIIHLWLPSISSAQKIHISGDTKVVLDDIGGYETEFRGYVEVKVIFRPNWIYSLWVCHPYTYHVQKFAARIVLGL